MDIIEKAKKIAQMLVTHTRLEKVNGTQDIKINTDDGFYDIKIMISLLESRVVFQNQKRGSYVVVVNEKNVTQQKIEDFKELFEIMEIAGEKILQKTFKSKKKSSTRKKVKNKSSKGEQINRLLDRYNDYGLLYTLFKDKKYKRKQNKMARLFKKINERTLRFPKK